MGKTRDLFKKMTDTKGIFHAKMVLIKVVTEQQQQYKKVVIMLVLLSTGVFDVEDKY